MTLSTSTRLLLRRLVAAPVVLLLLLVSAVAAAPAQAARDLRASVKGIVLDAATGKGVPGTTVYVMAETCPWGCGPDAATTWEPLASAVTSRTGAYSVTLPRAGTFRVFFVPDDRERYAMEAYPDAALPLMGDDVVVVYGKARTNISVKLDPAKRIQGHIWAAESRWDSEGVDDGSYAGLPGIPVYVAFQSGARIEMFIDQGLEPTAEPLGVGVTDEVGFYSVSGFKEYPFFIWANADPYGWSGGDPHFAGLDPADPTRRERIVDDGSFAFPEGVKTVDTFLGTTDEMNIRGRLVDEYGAALPAQPIVVWESDQSEQEQSFQPMCTVYTDLNGEFGNPATMTDPDEVACLNLVEPFALLEFPGTDLYQPEFLRGGGNPDEASWVPVTWGWPTDVGDWTLSSWPVEQE